MRYPEPLQDVAMLRLYFYFGLITKLFVSLAGLLTCWFIVRSSYLSKLYQRLSKNTGFSYEKLV
jgi:hypothetical protein